MDEAVHTFFEAVDEGALCVAQVRTKQEAESHYSVVTRTAVVGAPDGQATDALSQEVFATLCLAFDAQNEPVSDAVWSRGGEADPSEARQAFIDVCAFGPDALVMFGEGTCEDRVQLTVDTMLRDTYLRAEVPASPVTLVELGRVELPEAGFDSVLTVLGHVDGALTLSVEAESGGAIQSFAEVAPGTYEPRETNADILPFLPGPENQFDLRGWTSFASAAVHWDGLDLVPAASVTFSQGQAVRLFATDEDGVTPVDVCPPQRDADGVPPWSGDLFAFGNGRLGVAWIDEPGEVVLLEVVHSR